MFESSKFRVTNQLSLLKLLISIKFQCTMGNRKNKTHKSSRPPNKKNFFKSIQRGPPNMCTISRYLQFFVMILRYLRKNFTISRYHLNLRYSISVKFRHDISRMLHFKCDITILILLPDIKFSSDFNRSYLRRMFNSAGPYWAEFNVLFHSVEQGFG